MTLFVEIKTLFYVDRIEVKSLIILLSIITLSFFSTSLYSQHTYITDKTTRFDKMGIPDGLSSLGITCIHQDKFGFIWIGTEFALNLYDGYEVKVFNADPKNPRSIFNGHISYIYEEDDGTLWFGTEIGISKYNRANQTFSNFIHDTINIHNSSNSVQKILQDDDFLWVDVWNDFLRFNKKTGKFTSFGKDTINPSKGIYSSLSSYMFIDKQGVLWITTSEVGDDIDINRFNEFGDDFELNRFNKETETFTHFINDSTDPKSFTGKEVMSITEDKNGTLWLATLDGLLEMTDKEKGKFRQYVHDVSDSNSIISNELRTVFEDSKGNIWIGGSGGFSVLNKPTGQFTNYQIPDFSKSHNFFSKSHNLSNIIKEITEDSKGNLLLTSLEGFFIFNPSSLLLLHYLNDSEQQFGLGDNYVNQAIIDKTEQVWIATWFKGINRINQFSNVFKSLQKKNNVNNSLSSNYVSRFFIDSKNHFWVGCYNGGGLNKTKINKQKAYNNFEHFISDPADSKSISGNSINALYEDHDHILWVGTRQGLNRYNDKSNDFTRFKHDPNDSTSISNNGVEAIFEDSHGIFWIGTRYGLNIMDKQTGKFIQFVPDKNRLVAKVSADTRVIFEDSYGELWFGGDFLKKLNRKDTNFITYFSDSVGLHDFNLRRVWGFVEDDSANLWISTLGSGLFKYNRNDESFTNITTENGLISNTIVAVEIDDRGIIWASSLQGLSRVNPHDFSIRNFDDADGLLSLGFIDRSSFKDKDGWLYFGNRDGLNIFHPDSIKDNKCIPPVYITSLTIAGNQKYFDKPLFELEKIDLNYDENDFSFDFVALSYINPQKNQYAYMLEGYDEEWKYVGDDRIANYTNMRPGTYTFRVKASNNDDYWNEEGASLMVTIFPPFWATWWAYGVYVFIFLIILYLIRRNELRKVHMRQELELKNVQAESLATLDKEKNKFFSNISHEFRTPLTLILGPLDRLINQLKNDKQKQEVKLVRRNASRLQTLINQLLSLSKLESGKMMLKTRPENIVKLSSLFIQSFYSLAEAKNIKLEFESDAEEHIVYLDTLKYEKVVNNLLSNAIKFTEREGKIKVTISSKNHIDRVNIKFSDTGIGIRKEKLPYVFDRFFQVDEQQMKTNLGTGIGMALTKDLVELHHGSITVESEPGMGTSFTLVFHKGKEHLAENEIIASSSTSIETDDKLVNDDYLFIQDDVSSTELAKEVDKESNLPLLLLVEDNEDMRSYIKSYLVDSYQIIEAANGKDGADLAIEHLPDLIISDLMMPQMDGNEMTSLLKSDERTSHIPIILLTAKVSQKTKLEGLETGADDFLTKPFDANELLLRIKNLVEQRARLRKLLSQHIGDVVQTRIIKDSSGKAISKLDEKFLEKANNLIDKHMANADFSVEMLAKEMAMSRVQLHRKLKSLTDNSASDLIRNLRLKKAADLLQEGELNVTQVSYEVGISSLSYFAKVFKEKYGVSPSDYS